VARAKKAAAKAAATAESDRALAWEHLALLADPENFDLEGDFAEVAESLDRLINEAYVSDFGRMSATDALAAILVIRQLREDLAKGEAFLIEAARELGATWERVAPALEVGTRQAAERRYTSLKMPFYGEPKTTRARIEANRNETARTKARRRFVLANAEEIVDVAEQVLALPGLQEAVDRIARAEKAAGRPAEVPARWPARLAAELRRPGGADPSATLYALAQMPRPDTADLAGHGDLAALAGKARDLEDRQQHAVLDVMRRRYNRRDGLPEDYVDQDE